jgi:uncharacterized protein
VPAAESGPPGGLPGPSGFRTADRLSWGWRLVLFLSLSFALTAVLGWVAGWVFGPPSTQGGAAVRGLAAGLPAALLASWVMMSCVESRPLAALGLCARSAARELARGVLVGAAIIGLLFALFALLGWIQWEPPAGGLGAPYRALLETSLFLGLAALLEELLFRGYPFQVLAERFGPVVAIGATGVGFAAAHAANPGAGAVALANTALAGILLGVLYWRTFSLWVTTGAHFGWNATMSLLADLPVSGLEVPGPVFRATLTGPEILTGGAYGPEGGLALLAVLAPAIGWSARSRLLRRDETVLSLDPLIGRRAT